MFKINIIYKSQKEASEGDFSVKERRKLAQYADNSFIQCRNSSFSFGSGWKEAVFEFNTRKKRDSFMAQLESLEIKNNTIYSCSYSYPKKKETN